MNMVAVGFGKIREFFSGIGFKALFEYWFDWVLFVIIRGYFGRFRNRARKHVLLRT